MIFQTFWQGELSPYERLCLKSFTSIGHGIELFTYDRGADWPDDIDVRNAGEIVDQGYYFVQGEGFGCGIPAAFSDYFRYRLLYLRGGWWIDTDVVCLGDIADKKQFFAYQDDAWVNNAILRFEQENEVIGECQDVAGNIICFPELEIKWGATGPFLLTEILWRHGMLDQAESPRSCYPIPDTRILDIYRPHETDFVDWVTKDSMFLHLWNARLVDRGINKFTRPPKGSWLRKIADRLEIDGWT